MEEPAEELIEKVKPEERRRIRMEARRRTWYGWGNLHSVSVAATKQKTPRPMVRQKLTPTALLPIFFAVPLLVLMIVVFISLWPRPHQSVSAQAPAVTAKPKKAAGPTAVPSKGKTNLLLLGSDQRQGDQGFRTDVIILVSIDADNAKVSAVSFPRDLWVKVPLLYEMKINQVMGLGGFEAMASLFEANFGVTPNYYVLTNFAGFSDFIDLLKGIDVEVGKTLTDDCDLPWAKDGDCTVEPGTVWMEGDQALWYVRSRKSTDDIDRLRRDQEVLKAVFKKMMTRNALLKLPQIEAALKDNVETNLSVNKALTLAPVAEKVFSDSSRIQTFSITEEQSTPMISWNGMWILLPDEQLVHEVLVKAGMVD